MNNNKLYKKYQIGDWTYGTPKVFSWREGTTLKIGRFCAIADGVIILLGGEHRIDWVTTYPFTKLFPKAKGFTGHPRSRGNVIIKNDVWIGTDALILSGVTIGNGAVIAARSVVKENVLPYSIVAGNPAKHIKFRFSKSIIDDLQKIAWWNWPLSKIEEAWPLLLSSDIGAFVDKYKA
ncbi:MAG: CatB-related O-acetyltransferase [Deltaproteobacteria bacterium]|nr:CatB-related O-acetyltransferase [Deltaproteobacteria bacterium]